MCPTFTCLRDMLHGLLIKRGVALVWLAVALCMSGCCATLPRTEAERFMRKHRTEARNYRFSPAVLDPILYVEEWHYEWAEGLIDGVERRMNDAEVLKSYLENRRRVRARARKDAFELYDRIQRMVEEGGELYWFVHKATKTTNSVPGPCGPMLLRHIEKREGLAVIRDGEIVLEVPYNFSLGFSLDPR